jgi:LuxR family maltose regulon positive regulatory protein
VSTPILSTKLFIPSTRPELVTRPQLIEKLNDGLHRKLTLVSAPAGFGKTTLISAWVGEICQGAPKENKHKVTWLSLDEGDNDLVRFLSYFIAALNQIDEIETTFGKGALSMLQSPQPPPSDAILTSLINEFTEITHKIILVLDDYHLIEAQPVHDALVFLLEHLPMQMHLVIATREDPNLSLSRHRASNQLTEMRAAELRFTTSEAAEFLNQSMGLTLSEEDIIALETRTEGWIAGLQLAAISLQNHKDSTHFINSFTGSHRLVLDYLIEEVLNQQPERVQTFLLQTAIINRLTASLCNALTDQEDGQETLEMLERANLFIIPLDDERNWYRYHHLFADILRQRLQLTRSKQLSLLHIRASEWYEKNGSFDEAIKHALHAKDFDRAAGMLELVYQNMSGKFLIEDWLGLISKIPSELIQTRPVISTQYGEALLDKGELEAGEKRFQDAERWLEHNQGEGLQRENLSSRMVVMDKDQFRTLPATIAVCRAQIALAQGDVSGTVQQAELALKLSPEEGQIRSRASVMLGLTYWGRGELEAAYEAISAFVKNMERSGNIYFAVASSFGLGDIRIAQGRLNEAISSYKHFVQIASDQDENVQWITAHHHSGLAMIYHEKGEREDFEMHQLKSKELGEKTTLIDWPHRWHIALAKLKETAGDLHGALELLEGAKRAYIQNLVPDIQPVEALKARVYIKQGNLASAMNWVHERGISVDDDLSYLSEFEHITLARVIIAEYKNNRTERDILQAIGLLERLLKAAEDKRRMGSVIEILVVKALAHDVHGNTPAALVALKKALALAEPEGYIHIFVDEGQPMARLLYETLSSGISTDYVKRILAAFQFEQSEPMDQTQTPATELIEPLSDREIEVLRLIADGLTRQEIAVQLVLALNTVKTHARNIYSKLGVHNQMQAVGKAKSLGLLDNE